MNLLGLLVVLLVFCFAVWATRALMGAFGIGDPWATVIYVIIGIFALVFLLQLLGYGGGLGLGSGPMLRR